MNRLRIILDTNILISGLLLSSSTSQQVFDWVTAKETMLISESTYEEISQTLIRKKFEKYLSLEKRLQFISALRKKTEKAHKKIADFNSNIFRIYIYYTTGSTIATVKKHSPIKRQSNRNRFHS